MKKNMATLISVLFIVFSACTTVQNIEVLMDLPTNVEHGSYFVIDVKLKNVADKPQELVSIDIGDSYLKGITVIKTDPPFLESLHVPFDNSVSYSFNKQIFSMDSLIIRIYCKAVSVGDFSDDIDFCINSDYTFLTKQARTIVE